mmetsp:Transcript_11671/g.19400  ORF Transcript_11671/g.19400 Transcript_11671/m.19400 type:complete len:95 (-) Transcript_11671:272-556(-)
MMAGWSAFPSAGGDDGHAAAAGRVPHGSQLGFVGNATGRLEGRGRGAAVAVAVAAAIHDIRYGPKTTCYWMGLVKSRYVGYWDDGFFFRISAGD